MDSPTTHIPNEDALEELLSRPGKPLCDFIRSIEGPLVILGATGKMGPSLARMAARAAQISSHPLEVIAVSRFTDNAIRHKLEADGIRTHAANVLNETDVASLPDASHVIYLVGVKFGTQENPDLTWATNTLPPAFIAKRYRSARIVAMSTGNVYPMVPVESGGAREDHSLTPLGEYANAAVARERIFSHFATDLQIPMAILRLNYAVELRYGVLAEIARQVWMDQPVDVTPAAFNCIWQGDANDFILRSLSLAAHPLVTFNMTGAETLSVRETALHFGQLLGREVTFRGTEAPTALLNNSKELHRRLGPPPTPLNDVMRWIADWIQAGGRNLNKPTRYEIRNGIY